MKRDTSTDQLFTLYKNLAAASPEAWVPLPSGVLTGRILQDSEEQAVARQLKSHRRNIVWGSAEAVKLPMCYRSWKVLFHWMGFSYKKMVIYFKHWLYNCFAYFSQIWKIFKNLFLDLIKFFIRLNGCSQFSAIKNNISGLGFCFLLSCGVIYRSLELEER